MSADVTCSVHSAHPSALRSDRRERPVATEEQLMERLATVEDPELRESIVDLGLIYGVEQQGSDVTVTMTLTSPGCPLGGMIEGAVSNALSDLDDVENVKV